MLPTRRRALAADVAPSCFTRHLAGVLCLLCLHCLAPAQTLYDAARGTLPAAQGWNYLALPGTATQSLTSGGAQLDTSALSSEKAGYFETAPVPLDRARGFAVTFTVQLLNESHSSSDRAGFSVIVLGQDKKGIELGFWSGKVFAQSDSPLFTHAEEANVNTTAAAVDYALIIGPTQYVLRTQAGVVLTGPVRDYTAFVGTFDPYETPNFLFFGDDTSSASAVVSLKRIQLISPPQLSILSPGILGWTGVSNQTYSVQRSLDLKQWIPAGSTFSTTSAFYYTNTSPGFFRVVWP